MRNFYIFDNTHNKKALDKLLNCKIASQLRLYVGPNFTEEDIRSVCDKDSIFPSFDKVYKAIRVTNIKWYINTHTKELSNSEWNPDFLMGITKYGRVFVSKRNFPTFEWYGNYELLQTLKSTPFAGSFNTNEPNKYGFPYFWSCVPALCFSYSSESIEFMAGILSTGIIAEYNGKVLVKYNKRIGKELTKLGIPIEFKDKFVVFISPLWPILCHRYMPQCLRSKWEFVPKAYRAQEYSSILWKVYTGKDPIVNKIPYLMSRRSIFYRYGSMRALRDMWVKNQLVELDSRFKKLVQEWEEKSV